MTAAEFQEILGFLESQEFQEAPSWDSRNSQPASQPGPPILTGKFRFHCFSKGFKEFQGFLAYQSWDWRNSRKSPAGIPGIPISSSCPAGPRRGSPSPRGLFTDMSRNPGIPGIPGIPRIPFWDSRNSQPASPIWGPHSNWKVHFVLEFKGF